MDPNHCMLCMYHLLCLWFALQGSYELIFVLVYICCFINLSVTAKWQGSELIMCLVSPFSFMIHLRSLDAST